MLNYLFAYLKNVLYVYNHTTRRLKRAFIRPNLAIALPIIFKLLNSLSIYDRHLLRHTV